MEWVRYHFLAASTYHFPSTAHPPNCCDDLLKDTPRGRYSALSGKHPSTLLSPNTAESLRKRIDRLGYFNRGTLLRRVWHGAFLGPTHATPISWPFLNVCRELCLKILRIKVARRTADNIRPRILYSQEKPTSCVRYRRGPRPWPVGMNRDILRAAASE